MRAAAWPSWIVPRGDCVVIAAEPVRAPLPHVAGHVVQPVAIGRERADRGRSGKAVGTVVLIGEPALEYVHHVLAVGLELGPPGKALLDETTARGVLPFRLARKPRPRPRAERERVVERDVDHRMVGSP